MRKDLNDLTDPTNKDGDGMGSNSANVAQPSQNTQLNVMNDDDTSHDCGTFDFPMNRHDGFEVELNQPHVLEIELDQPNLVGSRWCSQSTIQHSASKVEEFLPTHLCKK